MGDPAQSSGSQVTNVVSRKKGYKGSLVASGPKALAQTASRRIGSIRNAKNAGGAALGHAVMFLLKFAALETVRRVSRSKCPHVWHGLQALQVICYPPFKWIQRWAPLKGLVKGIQMISRPLLVLSVATALSDQSHCNSETSDVLRGSGTDSGSPSEASSQRPSIDSRTNNDEVPQSLASENWMTQLYKELETQGITLSERIDEDELHRFYNAAHGDFACFLLSVKKTIRWRETYRILAKEELEMWSNFVFWHGFDLENRPCLIVRLGRAFANLPPRERPRFAQAVISQVEHGVLDLVDRDNPKITVLVDCDGISPLRIPMQIIRSCSSLLQDNYPNRLGHLLVIRLPPVVRVIAQTFIQVLKPGTRKKLRIEGNMYHRILSEYLQMLPSYLGGDCDCKICSSIGIHLAPQPQSSNELNRIETNEQVSNGDLSPYQLCQTDIQMEDDWNRVLRTAVVGIVMVCALLALLAGLHDPESRPI